MTQYQVVYEMDARDAMNLAIAATTNADARFDRINIILNGNAIWRAWLERDMPDVMAAYNNNLPDWIANNPGATPQWKRFYLWTRLAVAAIQYSFLRRYNARLLTSYPPSSTIHFDYLNHYSVTIPDMDETLKLDIRTEWPRIMSQVARTQAIAMVHARYSLEHLDFYTRNDYHVNNMLSYLNVYFDTQQSDVATKIANILGAMWSHEIVPLISRGYNIYNTGLYMDRNVINGILSDFPRLVEKTRILVGSNVCANCQVKVPLFLCGGCKTVKYCGLKCATVHFETHQYEC